MKNNIRALFVLVLAMCLSLAAFAAPGVVTVSDTILGGQESEYSDMMLMAGDGTEASPYIITSATEFNMYANRVKNSNSAYAGKYYKLANNIDFKGINMVPFGSSSSAPFKGTFDGDGYALLNVSVNDKQYCGVIGYMTEGTVKNLKVSYSDMTSRKDYSNLKYFGGIVGYAELDSSKSVNISDCETSGSINVFMSNAPYLGGIAGYVKCENGNANITDCVTYMSFDVETDKNGYVAGFAAYLSAGSSMNYIIKNCVSYGDVSLVSSYIDANAAGFAAYARKDEQGWSGWAGDETAELMATVYQFENCAALGKVVYGESNTTAYVGGFIAKKDGEGTLEIKNSYRNASATVEGKSGSVSTGSYAYTAAEFTQSFYENSLGMNFTNKWYMSGKKIHLRTVAKSNGAATTSDKKDVRLSSNPGLRFISEIEMFKRDYGFEYGIIVARADQLGTEELTLDYTGNKVVGVGYDSTTDKFLEKDDETVVFTAVVHSIPEEHYGTELVARTYLKFTCGGETVVVYGNAQSSSLNASAQALRDSESYDLLTEAQKSILETMLPKV